MKTILYLGLEPPAPKKNEQIIHYPVIQIIRREQSSADILQALKELASFDYLIFTSKSAVTLFFSLNPNQEALYNKKWIAVGSATTKSLKRHGINQIFTATDETAEGIVDLIHSLSPPKHTQFLWPHSASARRIIPDALKAAGFPFEECILYDTLLQTLTPIPDLTLIDEIHFTSPSTVEGFLLAYGSLPKNKILHPIGPVTASALKKVADIRSGTHTLMKIR